MSALARFGPLLGTGERAFLSMLETAGGFVAYGGRWVVAIDDRATAERVAQVLDSAVR